jgi:transposase
MEPTRNAWVPVAAHFMAAGALVVLVPAERSADLRRYYTKHTKNDRLDSHVLAQAAAIASRRALPDRWVGSS